MDSNKEINENPPKFKCLHGCELDSGTNSHKCAIHDSYLFKRCTFWPECSANSHNAFLRGYFNERKWKDHISSCMTSKSSLRKEVEIRGEQKKSAKYAVVIAETLWNHEWGFIIRSNLNGRRDYNQVSAFNFRFESIHGYKQQVIDLKKKLEDFDKIIFILTGDGEDQKIQVPPTKNSKSAMFISLESLLEQVYDAFGSKIFCFQIASCYTMKSVKKSNSMLSRFGIPTVGYRKSVDWSSSTVVDLYFLFQLLDNGGNAKSAYEQVCNGMKGLVDKTKFSFWNPTPSTLAPPQATTEEQVDTELEEEEEKEKEEEEAQQVNNNNNNNLSKQRRNQNR